MNMMILLKAITIKIKSKFRIRKGLSKSYISLFLAMLVCFLSTAAWFTARDTATINSEQWELQSASSLRVNRGKQISNRVEIANFKLDEASSLDGRNIYFPTAGTFDDTTLNMVFREGNVGDENKRYVYKNFYLTGTSDLTYVYIKSYRIKVSKTANTGTEQEKTAFRANDDNYNIYKDELQISYTGAKPTNQTIPPDCPIRIAFIEDSAEAPVVIDPSALVRDYVENSNAVEMIDNDGAPSTKRTDADSFQSYYFRTGSPVFTLEGNQRKTVTMVVWLEGTLGNLDDYIGREMTVDIDIESNFVEMETVTFFDDTVGDDNSSVTHWVSNNNPIIAMSYKDPYSSEGRYKTVIMKKTAAYTWQAPLPKTAVTDISFYRLSGAHDSGERQGAIYNSWHTYKDVNNEVNPGIPDYWYASGKKDLQESRTIEPSGAPSYNSVLYIAKHGNKYGETTNVAKRLSPCIGYWDAGIDNPGQQGGGDDPTPTPSDTHTISSLSVNVMSHTWIVHNVNIGNAKFYAHLSTDEEVEIPVAENSNDRFELKNHTFAHDTSIEYFILRYTRSVATETFKIYNSGVLSTYTFLNNNNVSFDIDNDKKVTYH